MFLNFQRSAALAATNEFLSAVLQVRTSLTENVALALTPEWVIHPHQFFDAPHTRDTVLAAMATQPATSLWEFTPADDPSHKNATLAVADDAMEVLLESVVTIPEGPASTLYCRVDADCGTGVAGGADTFVCGDEVDQGICAEPLAPLCSAPDCTPVVCTATPACTVGTDAYCHRTACEARGPRPLDEDQVDAAMDQHYPPFLDTATMKGLEYCYPALD